LAERIDPRLVDAITDYDDLTIGGHIRQIASRPMIDDLEGNTLGLLDGALSELEQPDFLVLKSVPRAAVGDAGQTGTALLYGHFLQILATLI
ncbi:MAG: hypothetical protein AAFY90_03545, partial [Pseudomonadota bacterium]